MPKQVYNFLKQQSKKGIGCIHWFCETCNPRAISAIKVISKIKDDLADLTKKVKRLDKEYAY